MVDRVDDTELISHAMSMIAKMLLTADQKKELMKSSMFKFLADELHDTMTDDDIMIRVESLNIHGKVSYKTMKVNKCHVYQIVGKQGTNKSFHEMITSDMMRMVFDIDDTYNQDDLDYHLQ